MHSRFTERIAKIFHSKRITLGKKEAVAYANRLLVGVSQEEVAAIRKEVQRMKGPNAPPPKEA